MAYTTTTAAAAPARTRSTAEQQAAEAASKVNLSNAALGLPVTGFAVTPHDPMADEVWNEALKRVLDSTADQTAQAQRWQGWWNTSTAPGRAATPAYAQEQVIADYLNALGQTGAQREADYRAEQAKLAAARGGGRGGGGGGGRRRSGGGGSSGGALLRSPSYQTPVYDSADLDAWIRALTPPAPVSRYAGGMGGAPTFMPSESPYARKSTATGKKVAV